MRYIKNRLCDRLSPLLTFGTLIGVTMIVVIWASTNFHLQVEERAAIHSARQNTDNLARVFEEHIVRTVAEVDKVLLSLRTAYGGNFRAFDAEAAKAYLSDMILQIAAIGPDGFLIRGTVDLPPGTRVDLSDREHFRVHLNTDKDELFISVPVIGRTTGQSSIQLTRPVRNPDGSFAGIIVASIDQAYLLRFYDAIDVGEAGTIAVIGLDKVVRASRGYKISRSGSVFQGVTLFNKLKDSPTGFFVSTGSNVEDIKRFISYRKIHSLPLIISVGLAEREVMAEYWKNRRIYYGAAGLLVLVILVAIGIASARRLADQRIIYMARHDALTGIANRSVLNEQIDRALADLAQGRQGFAVFILDLDGFKYVNDTLGHAAGDELLKGLAQRLRASLRQTERLARLGGDEFAIIQFNTKGRLEDEASALANRMLNIVAKPFDIDGRSVRIETSIGIALAPKDGVETGDLLKKADLALYQAKSHGRSNFRFFDAKMSEDATARHQLLDDMRGALARNEFDLHYQPIFDAKTAQPCGAEALIRWNHPLSGQIPPDEFVWLAEEAGLIEAIGKWVLRKACADAAAWPADIKVAVNVSAVQFRSGNLLDIVQGALAESGLPSARLELEITESLLLKNTEDCGVMIQQLKNAGVSIVLDDFGTGYSSLRYLTMFPIDKIKIDKSFTQGLADRHECAAIVASVLTLARGFDMVVTAEGVETREQFELLRAVGVNQVQGYLFARPVAAAELDFSALMPARQPTVAA